ncbi:MAG: type II secretion system F family protein, partial [Clostridia bacterium]|nr:type II secretion system F family protein [Deltaproteobacteria bacterium]
MSWLVPILAALSIFFLMIVVAGVLSRALQDYATRYVSQKVSDLSEMFFFVGRDQVVVLTFALAAIGSATGVLMGGPVITIVLTVLGLFGPTLLVRFYRQRRVKLFDRQLVDALVGMASAFRAGMTLYQAMEEIARTSPAPLNQEFALTVREIRLGTNTDEALESLAVRVGSDDLRLVVTSVNIARGFGGNMAEMFDTISGTIRERFRIEGRIRALTAQGRLQGVIIGLMPVLVWVAFDFIRPDLTRPMLTHWFGVAVIGLVV